MRDELLKLCELQEIDAAIDTREEALDELDDGTSTKAEIAQLTADLDAAQKNRHAVETEYFDHDLELKTIEARKKKAEDAMYSGRISNLKELDDLQKEVAMFNREIDKISTKVLELMDALESAKKVEKECKASLDATQTRLAEIVDKYEKVSVRLSEELTELRAKREAFVPSVRSDLLKRYEQIQQRQGVLAIGKVDDDVCGGCHVSIPGHLITAIQTAKTLQTCDSCGRILVWVGEE